MEKNNAAENKVRNKGKMPESSTSTNNTACISKSFKVTPEQNELLNSEVKKSGGSLSDYVRNRLFDSTPIFSLDHGHEILAKLADCANLLSDKQDNIPIDCKANLNEIKDLLGKVEHDISFTLDYINIIKPSLTDENGGE